MPKWTFNGRIDDSFDDEDFDVDEDYTGFEKIEKRKSDEEFTPNKKKSSVKHQKRPDKE